MFVCNGTPTNRGVDWLLELTGDASASGPVTLANSQARIDTSAVTNDANPSDVTVDAAMLGDSNTTVTCKDSIVGNVTDTVIIFVEGEYKPHLLNSEKVPRMVKC